MKKMENEDFKINDWVTVVNAPWKGKITKVFDKDVEIVMGKMKTIIKKRNIQKSTPEPQQSHPKPTKVKGIDWTKRMNTIDDELHIRKMHIDEAIPLVEKFIDDALLVGIRRVRIVHGKGWGILKKMIKSQLANHPHIVSIHDEHDAIGGSGVSVINFK